MIKINAFKLSTYNVDGTYKDDVGYLNANNPQGAKDWIEYSKWNDAEPVEIIIYDSIFDLNQYDRKNKILAKLTPEEREILGV